MSPPVFLADGAALERAAVVLDGPEGRHAAAVRRLRAGERVDLTDGAGLLAECVVTGAGKVSLTLEVLARHREPPPAPRLVVVQALPKGDRGELAVETMTEVGVDEIVPWSAARCVTQWKAERGAKALARWRSTAREAGKQARRARLPEVADLASTKAVAARIAGAAGAVVLHEEAAEPLSAVAPPTAGDLVVVVGPEGGIAPEELEAFADAGGRAVRLGPTVLRTSTAGVAAASVLLAATGRW
ncbi:16S rRNA (uracil(1498)-N(3))-methyltransferase [Actinomadura parmotrematis]|uniref:Ribosomal RNA small subunit methyltransferase E n=1 Tax=Actinomadura parmotrematis TaxID=2864039 RepID=A0ABS7FT14_9ACTN|nr:16S rRNA (uracil(1498)-N(3))-methyltransferase [Actinomadura parmotrematis]MBW8483546.1 16S rRNA (uracil(1498)-N(3))-methyltransferase [Actinomadura parmotrematis]